MRHTTFRARAIGWMTALGGVLLVVSVLPFVPTRILNVSTVVAPFGLRVASHVVSLLVGVMLLFLAGQLGRKKHRAWQVAIALFSLSFVANVVRLDRPFAGAFSLVMVVLLLLSRREFQAPPDPPTLFQFLRFVPLYLMAVVSFGLLFLFVQRRRITPEPTIGRSLDAIFSGLIGLPGSYEFQSEFIERVFRVSMFGLGVVGLVVALALLFRPIVAHPQQDEDAWEHASRLVHTYGSDTLAYFALRDDKSFFFSSDGEAMIAYTYIGRYALASGDPIGRPESLELVRRRVPRHVPPASLGRRLPRGARVEPRSLRRPGPAHLLPRRRGGRGVQGLQPQGQEVEEHPPVGGPGRAHVPLRVPRRDRGLTRADRRPQRAQRQVAGQGSGAGLHHEPESRRRRLEPRVPAVRRARRGRQARRLPAHRAGLRR